MTTIFTPRREVLPAPQRWLWPQLAPAASLGFVLYGGTAIALRLGHRTSVDFDFFLSGPLDLAALTAALPFLKSATTLQQSPDTYTTLASDPAKAEVKISFFGLPGFGRIGQPEQTDDGVMRIASADDLLATKLKTILQRAESKDYRDIAALLRGGTNLATGLAGARVLFGRNFQPSEALKALVYFDDGDLATLARDDQTLLIDAATSIGELPRVALADATV